MDLKPHALQHPLCVYMAAADEGQVLVPYS